MNSILRSLVPLGTDGFSKFLLMSPKFARTIRFPSGSIFLWIDGKLERWCIAPDGHVYLVSDYHLKSVG